MSRKEEIEGYIATTAHRSAVGRYIDLNKELGSPSNDPILFASQLTEIEKDEYSKKQTKEEISVAKTDWADRFLTSLKTFVDDELQILLKDKIKLTSTNLN